MRQFLLFFIAMFTAGVAFANFVGLESELVSESEYGTVYRVYATFDNPTDELVAIYALQTAPISVTCSTSFYQSTAGSPLATGINPAFIAFFPDLAYDSWFTIGSENSNGTSDIQQVGMDIYFDEFESGNGFTIDTFVGGSIFLIPNVSSDAEAGDDFKVLIGQFTTDGEVSLCLNFQWDDVNANTFNDEGYCITFQGSASVPGCTDPDANNYDSDATEDDGSCEYDDECAADQVVEAGNYFYSPGDVSIPVGGTVAWSNVGGFHNVNGDINTLTGESFGNPEAFFLDAVSGNADGVCIGTHTFNVPGVYNYDCSIGSHAANGMVGTITVGAGGCTDASADNYNPSADYDDGSCQTSGGGGNDYVVGLDYELVASDPLGTGQHTYRLYVEFTTNDVEVTAVYGTDTTPWEMSSTASDGFYNDPLGSDFGGAINPMFFPMVPSLEYDSWFTIGAQPGDADGINSAFDAALTSLVDFNSGGDFIVDTFVGGSIFIVPGANTQGIPINNRVLLGQFTTSGVVSALVNVQFRDANQESNYAEGMALTFPAPGVGCTDENACNYDPEAVIDAGCVYPEEFYNCDGCINDTDGDGLCDELEVEGCTDSSACNYDSSATDDDGSCLQNDLCGVCGGDNSSCSGCTDSSACNYDSSATLDDGSCTYPEMYYDCNGNCVNDTDGDGICDELEVPGCTDADADNYNSDATDDDGSCEYLGCTNPAADNYDEGANVDDGSCIIYGCTNPAADNYNEEATDDDGSCVASGCTYVGATNYDPVNTSDDGSCIFLGCTDSTALNFIAHANSDDGSCVFEECTGESDCPFDANGDGEIGSADLLEFLVAYGQACSDL